MTQIVYSIEDLREKARLTSNDDPIPWLPIYTIIYSNHDDADMPNLGMLSRFRIDLVHLIINNREVSNPEFIEEFIKWGDHPSLRSTKLLIESKQMGPESDDDTYENNLYDYHSAFLNLLEGRWAMRKMCDFNFHGIFDPHHNDAARLKYTPIAERAEKTIALLKPILTG